MVLPAPSRLVMPANGKISCVRSRGMRAVLYLQVSLCACLIELFDELSTVALSPVPISTFFAA